jgi:small subunit ribosomal protein S20
MPQRTSAAKSLRQSKKRQQLNKPARSRLTTETRRFERAVERGDAKAAQGQLDLLTKLLQKAVTKGIIKTNTAARRQARFQKQLNGITAAEG